MPPINYVRRIVAAVGVACLLLAATGPAFAQKLASRLMTSDTDYPVWIGHAPNDASRLFFIERFSGKMRILRNGVVLPTPFVDITGMFRANVDGGFLGATFHPDYDNNGLFYIYYTDTNGDGVVWRYHVSADPDVADASSAFLIIKVLRNPADDLHAGGFIDFSPIDGYMYISTGDGGPQGDPFNHAQDMSLLLGKILRIDVNGGSPYAIPPDNPFVNDPNARPEIWAIGFRNPWRACFDRETGDMFVGDVGQNTWEEIDFIAVGDAGHNYGWAIKEGTHCYRPPSDCDPLGLLTDPILDYEHRYITRPYRCAVTAGNVYRGSAIPLLRGSFFFSDFCSNEILAVRYNGNRLTEFRDYTSEVNPPGGYGLPALSTFGEDADGEIYLADYDRGAIYQVTTRMQVDPSVLIAGRTATVDVTGATSGANVYFVYSLSGIGKTPVAPLNVTLALKDPRLAGTDVADNFGRASIQRFVPRNTAGLTVWLQAAEDGNTSNVAQRTIQ